MRSPTRRSPAVGAALNAARCSFPQPWISRTCSSGSSRRSSTRPATSVARRFGYAYVDEHGRSKPAGPAPYLDCVAAPGRAADDVQPAGLAWLADAEDSAQRAGSSLTSCRRTWPRCSRDAVAELERARDQVEQRLSQESNRLDA